jgi:ATP synthase protein I
MTRAPVRPASNYADRLLRVARQAVEREKRGHEIPELSLGARLGQIGVLGWAIIVPTLLGLFLGRWLDHSFIIGANHSQVFFSATFLTVGVAIGFWSAWRWMHRRGP